MKALTFALASALALGALAFAPAAAARETPSTQVRFADLNLDREAGARVMLARINLAARAACGHRTGPMPLRERMQLRVCIGAEAEEAVAELANPTVTALYYNRRPRVVIASR